MTDDKLIGAYHEAMGDYETAKAGVGNRVETFTRFLVAERVLAAPSGADRPGFEAVRTRYSPLPGQPPSPVRNGADTGRPRRVRRNRPTRVIRPARMTTPRLGGGVGASFRGPKLAFA
jgi:hypothetical protein